MADAKISALPPVTTPAGTDQFAVNQAGTSKMETAAQLFTNEVHAGYSEYTGIADPATPATGSLRFYSQSFAGRMLPKFITASGVDVTLQPALFGNAMQLFSPAGSTVGTGVNPFGAVWTSNGTVSTPTPVTTAPAIANQMRRTRYANIVTTTNQQLGPRCNAADQQQFWRGNAAGLGGFFFFSRFIVELIPAATVRIFAGLTGASATASVCISDTVVNDTCGLWHDTTDSLTTFNLVTRNQATTTKTAMTVANSIAAGNAYDFFMWCAPNGATIFAQLYDINNNLTVTANTATTLPTATVFMQPQVQMSNGTANITVTTVAIGVVKIYVESDN